MKRIAINYAYNGFLYAPLFLADKLGLLPQNIKLVPRHGDIETASTLGRWTDKYDNWFAICDPFAHGASTSHGLSSIAHLGGDEDDPLCIIGAFVGKLPVWLYNTDSTFGPFHFESQLKVAAARITRIICYKQFNTGYLIGKRLCELIAPDAYPGLIHEANFGAEFNDLKPTDLVVTSDVLAVANSLEADNKNVVLRMFTCDKLDPFLFTAILTRRSIVDNELPTVLSVLAGLRTAVRKFETNSLSDAELEVLVSHFKEEMPDVDAGDVRRGIKLLCDTKVYAGDLDIDTAERGYENARREWFRLFKKEYSPAEKQKEPIPSLLIRKDWKRHVPLAAAFAETWKPLNNKGQSISAVKAVAEEWKDDDGAVMAVATTWAENGRSKDALLRALPHNIHPKSRVPLVWPTAACQGAVLIAATMVSALSHRFLAAMPALVGILLLTISGLTLISYLPFNSRKQLFWWLTGGMYVAQVGATVFACRDVFITGTDSPWGYHEACWGIVAALLIAIVATAIAESKKEAPVAANAGTNAIATGDGGN